jgi:hypothetical protein
MSRTALPAPDRGYPSARRSGKCVSGRIEQRLRSCNWRRFFLFRSKLLHNASRCPRGSWEQAGLPTNFRGYHINAVPGRKIDVKELRVDREPPRAGLIRARFIPPPPIRDLRDLTRIGRDLIWDRVKATNRAHKLLADGEHQARERCRRRAWRLGPCHVGCACCRRNQSGTSGEAQPHAEGEAARGGVARPVCVAPCLLRVCSSLVSFDALRSGCLASTTWRRFLRCDVE